MFPLQTRSSAHSAGFSPGRRRPRTGGSRRGAATVEFALIAPLYVLMVLGICEFGRGVNASSVLNSAIRDGGRLACMDFRNLIPVNTTANQKIEQDIRAFLSASGFPGNQVTITITHADGEKAGQTFDLSAEENYLKLFRISASIPYVQISQVPVVFMRNRDLTASVVFRRGRVNMSE